MKISKLFHWLYATLMFLPFIFFVPTLIYYGFNEHAIAQETTREENTYYESNEVSSFSDLTIGNIYQFTYKDVQPSISNVIQFNVLDFIPISYTSYTRDVTTGNLNNRVHIFDYNGYHYFRIYRYIDNVAYYYDYYDLVGLVVFDNNTNSESIYTYLSYTNQKIISGSEPVTYTQDITGSVDFSWQRVWSLPLFSWTSNSFISQPFTYITSLFGMQPTNTFNNVVTYFVTVSICWLVFDLLMYVPNLVHRWLDRGAIQ